MARPDQKKQQKPQLGLDNAIRMLKFVVEVSKIGG